MLLISFRIMSDIWTEFSGARSMIKHVNKLETCLPNMSLSLNVSIMSFLLKKRKNRNIVSAVVVIL